MAVIRAKLARILFAKYSPMRLLLGFPNHVLDLLLEGRQTIIPGPEDPISYDSN